MTAPTPDPDVAFAAGAEAMREACAIAAYTVPAYVRGLATDADGLLFPGSVYDQGRYDARKAIEALPLPPAPTDGAF